MTFNKILSFFLLVIMLSGLLNDHESLNFEGDWYVVGHRTIGYTHWKISDKNHVQAYHQDPELISHFQIIRGDDNQYILESEDFHHSPEIGKIINWEPDTIEFSSGLKMIRLTGETESPFSIKEFNEVLNNSIWRYELQGNTTTLYLSDSLNFHGYRLSDVIKTGDWNFSDRSISWDLESFNHIYVFSHLDVSEIVTILIDKANEHEFSGRLFYSDQEFPINVQYVPPASYDTIQSISSIITESEWKTVSNTPEADDIYLHWYGAINFKPLDSEDLSKFDFTFSFKSDQSVQLYLNKKLLENYFWEVSKDAEYLFVFTQRYGQFFFAKLDNLNNTPPLINLELDYFLSSEKLALPTGYLTFELRANSN